MSDLIDSTTSEIRNEFDAVFDLYRNLYLRIFDVLFPASRNQGFTERNQTVNFSKAYETLHPGSVTWFEMPFSKNRHMDAIIVDPVGKMLLFIESKQFSSVNSKITSVGSDIQRINQAFRARRYSIRARIPDYDSYVNRYGVILCDVWTQNNDKVDLCNAFRSNIFPTTHLSRCGISHYDLPNATCFARDFKGRVTSRAISDRYHLLAMIWTAPVGQCE